jgi:predicted nucleic acid-binding protein
MTRHSPQMSASDADAYPDSSFLVSLLRVDSNHEAAIRYMVKSAEKLAFTPLHRLELRNALRNAQAFAQITANERRIAFRQIEKDLQAGLLIHIAVNWVDVFHLADDLSEKHFLKNGQRTIDLLHVALALECGTTTFLSFDGRQRSLTKAVGFKVKP